MKTIFNTIAVLFIIAAFIGFMFLFGQIWDHRDKYKFIVGVLSLIGWLGMGALIVYWIYGLAKR